MSIDSPHSLSNLKRYLDIESRRINRRIMLSRIGDFVILCIATLGFSIYLFRGSDIVGIAYWMRVILGLGYGLSYGAATYSWIENIRNSRP